MGLGGGSPRRAQPSVPVAPWHPLESCGLWLDDDGSQGDARHTLFLLSCSNSSGCSLAHVQIIFCYPL
jgi:hypothetical protein